MLQYLGHWHEVRKTLKSAASPPLIDLRSPKEFSLGHIPGAINLPLLDDNERHQVGKLYKEAGTHAAISLGLEIFAAKCSSFLNQIEAHSKNTAVVLYCWRGGMRSRLVGLWLTYAGYEVKILKGGYKTFRQDTLLSLGSLAQHPKIVLHGRTGSGKTLLLRELAEQGYPTIDLERLANHRGSAFGDLAQEKISVTQQNFENTLYDAYLEVHSCPKILVELENFIGPVKVPQHIRESLQKSPMVFVDRHFADRVQILTQVYCQKWSPEMEQDFLTRLPLLKKYISSSDLEQIKIAIKDLNFSYVISQLLKLRYDRVYDKSLKRHQPQALAHFNLSEDGELAKSFLQKALT